MVEPDQWPIGTFDLIILSEVVYYFNRDDAVRLTHRVKNSLRPQGDVVLVHWLGQTDYPLSGDEAVTAFGGSESCGGPSSRAAAGISSRRSARWGAPRRESTNCAQSGGGLQALSFCVAEAGFALDEPPKSTGAELSRAMDEAWLEASAVDAPMP